MLPVANPSAGKQLPPQEANIRNPSSWYQQPAWQGDTSGKAPGTLTPPPGWQQPTPPWTGDTSGKAPGSFPQPPGSTMPWGYGAMPAGWQQIPYGAGGASGTTLVDPNGIYWQQQAGGGWAPMNQQQPQQFAKGGKYTGYANGGKEARPGPAIVGDMPKGKTRGRNPEYVFRPMGANGGM